MATFGPFYPSSLVNVSNGGTAWSISGATAAATIAGEGVTDLLVATGFNTSLPPNSVVQKARLELVPNLNPESFANSDQFTVGPLGEQQAYAQPPYVKAEADDTPGLNSTVVLSSSFGFKFSVYAQAGGTVSLSSLALYVDCA